MSSPYVRSHQHLLFSAVLKHPPHRPPPPRRIVRLLRHPIAALFGFKLTDYRSEAHATVHEYPQLVGIPFGKLHFYFPSRRALLSLALVAAPAALCLPLF